MRIAARSRAERARGLAAISASPGSTAWRVRSSNVGGSTRVSGACREPRGAVERSCRKRFTMRSSSEWKATTTSRPPSRSTASAAASACASSSSSRLTKMRSAWKVRVAGWMRSPVGPTAAATISASCRGALDRRLGARPLDGAGDASGLPLLAEHADDRRKLLRRSRRFTTAAASAPPRPCACRAARRGGRRSRAPDRRAAWRRRRRRGRRRRPARKPAPRACASRSEKRPSTSFSRPPAARDERLPGLDRRCGRGRWRAPARRAPGWRAL